MTLLSLLLIGCTGDTEKETTATLPQAFITWPTSDDVLQQGDTVLLVGYVEDAQYSTEPEYLRTLWKMGSEEWCVWEYVDAGGNTTCEIQINEFGEIPITLQVLNPDEQMGEVSTTIFINENSPPEINILSPQPTQNYYTDIPIEFHVEVTDAEELFPTFEGEWSSSIEGTLNLDNTPTSGGTFFDTDTLLAGEHTLTFTASENGVRSNTETLTINVPGPNYTPDCFIETEAHELIIAEGNTAVLQGSIYDEDIPATELNIEVRSETDGVWTDVTVLEDGSFTASFPSPSVGIQTITLTVWDEVETSCSLTADLVVGYGPEVEIIEPIDGTWFNEGELVLFQGNVSDANDAPEDLEVKWHSDYDGIFSENPALPNGTAVTTNEYLSVGQHIISLWAIDTDGFGVMDDVTVNINDLPDTPTISFTHSPATSSDDLIVNIDVESSDAENDVILYEYVWLNNGSSTTFSTDTIPHSETTRGDVWQVIVTPDDGRGLGDSALLDITIGNSPPILTSVSTSISTANETSSITCVPSTVYDEDGDTTSVTFEWLVNGSVASTTNTIDGTLFNKGDIVTCQSTAQDGWDPGNTLSTSPITISNSAPILTSAELSSLDVTVLDVVECNHPSATDVDPADANSLTYTYDWTVDGTSIGLNQNSIDGTYFAKGDTLQCTVTPTDGTDTGTPVLSSSTTVGNAPPTIDSATLSPSTAYENSTLTCAPVNPSDADGDTVSQIYEWYVNNTLISSTGNTLTGSDFNVNDTVFCRVTPSDGGDLGTSETSNSIVIQNSTPAITTPTISPNSNVRTNTILTCSATASDLDDGNLDNQIVYEWTSNTGASQTGATWELNNQVISPNDSITCTAYVTDSDNATVTQASSPTIVINTVPTLSTVTVNTTTAQTGDTLTCSATISDLDDGSITPTYTWLNGSNVIGSGDTYVVSAQDSNVGDILICQASGSDAQSSAVSDSSAGIVINNTAPILNTISISPNSGVYNDDTLTCSANGSDADQDGLTVSYQWVVNQSTLSTSATLNLTQHNLSPNTIVECIATVNDGNQGIASDSDNITIQNRSPVNGNITISNSQPLATDTVTCSVSPTDPDGDTLSINYEWLMNGSVIGTGTNISLSPTIAPVNGTLSCRVSSSDGMTTTTTSTDVTIANSTPSLSAVSLSPSSSVTTGTTLSCSATGSDPDDGGLSPSYQWFRNGTQVSTGSTHTLTSGNSDVGQSFYCSATVTDSVGATASGNSSTVTVQNTNPTISNISISASSGVFNNSSLSCSASASDPDQSVSVSYSWSVNGSTVASGSTINLGSYSVSPTDSVTCVASTSDSNGGSDSGSTSITVSNRAPSVQTPSLSASVPDQTDTVSCSSSASDPDGESVSVSYVWTMNGSTIGSGSSITLNANIAPVGGTLTCTASTSDGYGGSDSASASATINNNPPSISAVSISPSSSVTTGTTLSCSATGSDPDDGGLSPSYQWFRNGTQVSTGSTHTLTSGNSDVGQSFYCSATVTDSVGATASGNSSTVTVQNTNPTISNISISASSGVFNNSSLSCSASASDPDQSVSVSYSWRINGSTVASGSTINLGSYSVSPTDSISCVASTSDSNGGSDSGSTSVTVSNRAPTVNSVTIDPSNPDEYDFILCLDNGSDSDGDSLSVTYTWTINGQIYSNAQITTINGFVAPSGSTLTCIVTYTDPYGGTSSASASTTSTAVGSGGFGGVGSSGGNQPINILTAPTLPTVSIEPQVPSTDDDLICQGSGSVDPNGFDLSYHYVWNQGDDLIVSQILDHEYTEENELWTCTVYVLNEMGETISASDTVGIYP